MPWSENHFEGIPKSEHQMLIVEGQERLAQRAAVWGREEDEDDDDDSGEEEGGREGGETERRRRTHRKGVEMGTEEPENADAVQR